MVIFPKHVELAAAKGIERRGILGVIVRMTLCNCQGGVGGGGGDQGGIHLFAETGRRVTYRLGGWGRNSIREKDKKKSQIP